MGRALAEAIGHERFGAVGRSVGDDDPFDAAIPQRQKNGARRAAGPKDQGGARRLAPARRILVEMGDEAMNIGVVAMEPLIRTEPDGVHGPERPRELRRLVDESESRLLMRQGDVATAIARAGEAANEGRKLVRLHMPTLVGTVDAELAQPEAVHERRTRMGDRVPYDAGTHHEDGRARHEAMCESDFIRGC